MARQHSTTTRNRLRDAYIAAFPAGSVLVLRSGAPAGVTNSAGGTALATITLPATPLAAGTGQVTLSGSWTDASADANGTIAHYRLTSGSDIEEGTVTLSGGGGDMIVDNTNCVATQNVSITAWTLAMPAA